MWTASDLTFHPETHTTTTPDGADVPHVTHILEAVGVTTNFEELAELSPRVAGFIEHAKHRGSAVHADCHAYDDDDIVIESVDSSVLPYLNAWMVARRNLKLTPVTRERQVYHPVFNYTGILDGVFWCDHGPVQKLTLVDIKTGDPRDAAAHLQTAAYEMAYNLTAERPVDERLAIWLQPKSRIPYKVFNYTAAKDGWKDAQKWIACLTVYNEQPARRAA